MAPSKQIISSGFIRMVAFRIVAFLSLVATGLFFIHTSIISALHNNLALNAIILGAFGFGLCFSFLNIFKLHREISKLKEFPRNRASIEHLNWLAPLTEIIQKKSSSLSPTDTQIVLHKIDSRLNEAREVPKYLIGLLIFLGLLGTFWGLTQTITAVSGVISSLSIESAESSVSFDILREGLRNPLSGMGTAFSCSMFGLAGSLILGFTELQVGRAFARTILLIEEWLHHVSNKAPEKTALSPHDPDYLLKALSFISENLEKISTAESHRQDRGQQLEKSLLTLSDKTTTLVETIKLQQSVLSRLTEQQLIMQKWLQQSDIGNGEESLRSFLRTLETYLTRNTQENSEQLQKMVDEFRRELRFLGKILHGGNENVRSAPQAITPNAMKAL